MNTIESLNNKSFLVEGNIGAGKSTFLNKLSLVSENIQIIPEPVAVWTNYKEHNYL